MGGGGDFPVVRPEPTAACGGLAKGRAPVSPISYQLRPPVLYIHSKALDFWGLGFLAGHSPHPCASALSLLGEPFPRPVLYSPRGRGSPDLPAKDCLSLLRSGQARSSPCGPAESIHCWVKDSG